MPYTTYNQFRTAVQLMLDGDEVASVIQPQTIDTLIELGEGMIYTGAAPSPSYRDGLPPLRASSMEVEWADVAANGNVVADNAVAIPTDCLELVIAYFDEDKPLEVLSESELRPYLLSGGLTRYVAQAGESLIFAGPATDGDELLGRYYARPGPIKEGLHATFLRYPDLYLYAALASAAPFLGQSRKLPVWQGVYASLLTQALRTEQMRTYGGSRLRMRAR
jgi:hypothetical protein